jgi:hypothetical protein
MVEYEENKKKPIYKKWWFIIFGIIISIPIVVFEIACISVVPSILVIEFILALLIYALVKLAKKGKKTKELRLQKEREMIQQGYKKICDDFYINNEEHKLKILDTVYGFSQIIDCELIENGTTLSYTNRIGKIKNNNKAKLSYITSQIQSCTDLAVNITVDDFNNPRIVFDCKYGKRNISKNSKEYKEYMNNAQNIISALKIIIAQNNEKYIETGTITKVEHKYITEENASIQIERLSQLHKDGVLTDYEFEMKKKELLDKIK